MVAVLRERGSLTDVRATAGLSLGEYTAVHFAGCLSFADALRLVKRRGTAMQAAADRVKSGMVSLLGADLQTAQEIADAARGDGVLVVANVNGPGQIVLLGRPRGLLTRAGDRQDEQGAARHPAAGRRRFPLAADGAREARARRPLEDVSIRDAKIPVVCNVTATAVTTADDIRMLLANSSRAP